MKKNKTKNNSEDSKKVNVSWYPGHMAKTKREIIQDLRLIDVVIELLDARIPVSSRNPDIEEITRNKKKIVILNKCDLADDYQNKMWVEYFKNKDIPAILVDSNSGKGINECIKLIEDVAQTEIGSDEGKGRSGRTIRAMVLGIPNVGKSSFINRISKKSTAEVGNKPGVTKQKQWIHINDKIILLDTPGVLWPRFESEEVALHLCFTGSIKQEILDNVEIAYHLTKFMLENYKKRLCERYDLTDEFIESTLKQDQPGNSNIYEIMLEIGRKRGCLISGGNVDDEKTARIIIDDFKNGKSGKITIEKP